MSVDKSHANPYPESNADVIEKAMYCLKHGELESVENWLDLLRERLVSQPAVAATGYCKAALVSGDYLPGKHGWMIRRDGGMVINASHDVTAAAQINDASVAAIQYALDAEEGFEWLSLWNEGEFDRCRRDWPDAPEECYIGADPMHPETQRLLATTADAVRHAENPFSGRMYPDELTDTLRHVLGFPNFRCAPFAHLMRASGAKINARAEDEQAYVLHWFVKLVLDHGEQWADVAEEQLEAMREKVGGTPTEDQS